MISAELPPEATGSPRASITRPTRHTRSPNEAGLTGTASTPAHDLTVADSAKGATLSIAPTAYGTGAAIATIYGAIFRPSHNP